MMQAAAMAAFVRFNVDVAHGLCHGWQLHIGSGLRSRVRRA